MSKKAVCAKCINVILKGDPQQPENYRCKNYKILRTEHEITGVKGHWLSNGLPADGEFEFCRTQNAKGQCQDYFNPVGSTAEERNGPCRNCEGKGYVIVGHVHNQCPKCNGSKVS